MASKNRPEPESAPEESAPAGGTAPTGAAPTDNPSDVNAEDVLRPFQEAANRFFQAHLAAQETAVKQCAQAWLDYQDEVRRVEQEAYRGVVEATRKHLDQLGQQGEGDLEQLYSKRAQSQLEYENEIRRVYADAQAQLATVARKPFDQSAGGDAARQLASQRQDAYRTYLSDLQQAWSSTKALDPQTINSIASHILYTMNAVSQAG